MSTMTAESRNETPGKETEPAKEMDVREEVQELKHAMELKARRHRRDRSRQPWVPSSRRPSVSAWAQRPPARGGRRGEGGCSAAIRGTNPADRLIRRESRLSRSRIGSRTGTARIAGWPTDTTSGSSTAIPGGAAPNATSLLARLLEESRARLGGDRDLSRERTGSSTCTSTGRSVFTKSMLGRYPEPD